MAILDETTFQQRILIIVFNVFKNIMLKSMYQNIKIITKVL